MFVHLSVEPTSPQWKLVQSSNLVYIFPLCSTPILGWKVKGQGHMAHWILESANILLLLTRCWQGILIM